MCTVHVLWLVTQVNFDCLAVDHFWTTKIIEINLDAECSSGCSRELVACADACPCHPGCPNGCDEECENPICDEEPVDVDNQNVLIINNYVSNNYPLMVNFKEKLHEKNLNLVKNFKLVEKGL